MFHWPLKDSWRDTTKEERQFCADLYSILRRDCKELTAFVELLNTKSKKYAKDWHPLDVHTKWEIGLEVAFYRDYPASFGESHRKFDLAMFSDSQFVIIEAKAQGGYKRSKYCKHGEKTKRSQIPEDCELCKFDRDKERIINNFVGLDVYLIGLCTEHYLYSNRRKVPICMSFDAVITWNDLYKTFKEPSFKRANSVYNK